MVNGRLVTSVLIGLIVSMWLPQSAFAVKRASAALPLLVAPQSTRSALVNAFGANTRFGPYKYTASEGLVEDEFYAGEGDLPTHLLVVEQVDGATGAANVSINQVPVVSAADFTSGVHIVQRQIEVFAVNEIAVLVDESAISGMLVYVTGPDISISNVSATPDWIPLVGSQDVVISARVPHSDLSSSLQVSLEEIEEDGTLIQGLGLLTDDGSQSSGDSIAGDGVFSLRRPFSSAVPRTIFLQVSAENGELASTSAPITIEALVPVTGAESNAVVAFQEAALTEYEGNVPTLGRIGAAIALRDRVIGDESVIAAYLDPDAANLSITYDSGLTGTVLLLNTATLPQPESKQGAAADGVSPLRSPDTRPVDQRPRKDQPRSRSKLAVPEGARRIQNNRVLIFDPFAFERVPCTNYSNADEFAEIIANVPCGNYEVDQFVGQYATVDVLRRMPEYGLVYISTHGPRGGGGLMTGELVNPITSAKYSRDFRSTPRRLSIYTMKKWAPPNCDPAPVPAYPTPFSIYGITPQFVADYATRRGYPNSVIALGACYAADVPVTGGFSFPEAFIRGGANFVMAQEQAGLTPFMGDTQNRVLGSFIASSGMSIADAFQAEWPNGVCGSPHPDYPTMTFGCLSVTLHPLKNPAKPPRDTFRNGGFETGDFAGWHAGWSPNAGPLSPGPFSKYGSVQPSTGNYFARINLPPSDRGPYSNSISQRFCMSGQSVYSLEFDYNLIGPDLAANSSLPQLPFLTMFVVGSHSGTSGYLQPSVILKSVFPLGAPTSGIACSEYTYQGQSGGCANIESTGWLRERSDLLPRPSSSLDEWVSIVMFIEGNEGQIRDYWNLGLTVLIDNVRITTGVSPTRGSSGGVLGADVSRTARGGGGEYEFVGDAMAIPDHGEATTYPSEIEVSGVGGGGGGGDRSPTSVEIESMSVVLDGLNHTFPDDLDVLLVGPDGQTVLLMSDVGGGRDVDSGMITFTNTAAAGLPDDEQIVSGEYLPTNHEALFGDAFPPPAPLPEYGTGLDVFEGSDPNGVWKLFVVDNARGDRGELSAGWLLRFSIANRAPVAVCSDTVVEALADCTASASIDAGSTDPDGDELVVVQSPPGPYELGVTAVTLTVTDPDGLSSQCTATVTVVDSDLPEVQCPSGTSFQVTSGCLAPVPNITSASTAVDNCTASGSLVLSQLPLAGSMVGPGVHTITVSATDASNNTGTCTTTFTVVDAQPPTIAGPVPAIYLRTSSSASGATVTFPLPSASDNCTTVAVTAAPASGTTFPNGKTLVTATATDAVGLTASTQFTVKVVRFGESIGIYIPSTAGWFLRNTNTDGAADLTFSFGPGGTGWVPIAGDWDRSGTDTPGLFYNPTAGVFLSDTNGPGGANYVFSYGPSNLGWIPIAGDWNGEGVDSIGLYDPSTGNFFLKNINAAGNADVILQLGPGNAGFLPIVGDWNGDGIDTVGIYNPETGVFFLRNSNTNGPADLTFTYGAGGKGYLPISGDWNGDNICTIGLYDPSTGAFLLRNSNDEGDADVELTFGPSDQGAVPVAGSWDGQ